VRGAAREGGPYRDLAAVKEGENRVYDVGSGVGTAWRGSCNVIADAWRAWSADGSVIRES
jgi:hypothetical protein